VSINSLTFLSIFHLPYNVFHPSSHFSSTMQRIWSCGERCLGLWTLDFERVFWSCSQFAILLPLRRQRRIRHENSFDSVCLFHQSLIVVMAVRNRLALERKSHRSGHIPCDLRQPSGGNDLGEKSCTNDNSRSSCNQDALAAIPCRSFIVVGL